MNDETRLPASQQRAVDTESATFIEGRASDELNCTPGKEAEVIALLLEEYRALRAETTQRLTARIQVTGFIGVVVALLAATSDLTFRKPNLYFAFALTAVAWYWWHTMASGMYKVANQLQRLEENMNRLAVRAYGITGVSKGPFTWEMMLHEERSAEGRWVHWLAGLTGGSERFRERR